MREVAVRDVRVGNVRTVPDAFDWVFGESFMRHLYGPRVSVGPWEGDTRRIRGTVEVPGAPREVAKILGGGEIRTTTRQTVRWALPVAADVDHKVRFHFVGAELIRVRPSFKLRQASADAPVTLDATVRVAALLPPGISNVVEGFMERFAQMQLDETLRVLSETPEPGPPASASLPTTPLSSLSSATSSPGSSSHGSS